ncbi:MAG: PAS domain-containing protein [Bacteroidales bacterium]|nr:PAS domain-containing protein [Bacteroidales bacterium]
MDVNDFFQTVKVSITVSDREGKLVYMNDASQAVFGDKVGQNMMPCHQARSQEIIRQLLENGENHAYTIEKGEVHKMIYQAPWYKDGEVAGLVEFSMVIPAEMPHYVRPVKKD